ncbi:MAG: Ig-like domain-containing protein, partial [Bacteroidota bacterium]|nr:Ig-like domain-containing protein [Bacteroidota bacterium]
DPTHGTVVVNADGTYSYTPSANYNGPDSFSVTVSDGNGGTNTVVVNVTVTPVNDAPIATATPITTPEDTPINGTVTATDVDGDALTFSKATDPTHGTVVVNADGTYTYTPNANYNGPDSFSVTVSDGNGGTHTVVVTVKVTPVNDAPVATAVPVTTPEDTPINGTGTATDVDGDALTFSKATDPTHGTVVVNADGTYTYTPSANYNGPDSFNVTVSDGNGGTNTVVVNVTVTPVNDAPIAVNDYATTSEDSPKVINVLTNDSDVDGNALTITSVSVPTKGTVVVNGDGTITYTPNANANGNDSFTYTISDGHGGSSTATVNVAITPVNDLPVAVSDSTGTNEDTTLNGNLSANDILSGDGGNVWAKATNPAHGTVVVNTDGTYSYTPDANYNGPDSFTYTLTDANGDKSTATVKITVVSVNDLPVAEDDHITGVEETAVTGNLSTNDTPSGDGGNVWAIKDEPQFGTVVINSDGTFTYTPKEKFVGDVEFTYTITDANGDVSTAKVTITVEPVDVSIPEGFSPNGDGINDLLVIYGIEKYPNNRLMIFNRWGNKVFEAKSYDNSWNGENHFGIAVGGRDLPVGTYFYILDLGNGSPVKKGYIYLNR